MVLTKSLSIITRSYNIKGTLPKYIPPVAKESKLDDHIDPEFQEKIANHKHKNFM